jgi:hypothetical protein
LGLPPCTQAADRSQSGLAVKLIVQGDGGIYVGFASRPTDCAGEFQLAHAFLSKSSPDFTDFYALMATAKATGTPLTITYAIAGDCTTAAGLLQLSGVR